MAIQTPGPISMPAKAPPRRAIGLIVPSSNRVVERVASRLLCLHPEIDCCIARVPYGGILTPDGAAYRAEPFDTAAALLADARVDIICWNATRGAALGFEADRELCRRIEADTGIPAVSTALATLQLLLAAPGRRVGLITQGDEAESLHVVEQFRTQGVDIVDHAWLGLTDNLGAAAIDGDTLRDSASALALGAALDDVLIWSTNLAGAGIRPSGDQPAFGILDSTRIGIEAALSGIQTRQIGKMPLY